MSTVQARPRSPQWDAVSLQRKKLAGWRCEGCGMHVEEIRRHGGTLEGAHILDRIHYPDKELDIDNVRALCTFRNRRHPQRLGNGYGCHNAMSAHWSPPPHGYLPGTRTALVASRWKRHRRLGFAALCAAGILWTTPYAAWGWGALALSLVAWPELGLATALWALLLALGIHYHRLHAPSTFYGWLGWLAALLGLWCACLLATIVGLAHLLPALWRWVRR